MESVGRMLLRISVPVLLLTGGAISAPAITIGADGGASKAVGSQEERLDVGYSLAADGSLVLTDFLQVGARFSYTDWDPARDKFRDLVSDFVDIDGRTWSVEIAPFVRVNTIYKENAVNVFAQAGAGFYLIETDVTVESINQVGETVSEEFGDGRDEHFGFSVGGGITIGKAEPFMVRMYPLYHWVDRERNPDQYWTFNVGLVVGMGRW